VFLISPGPGKTYGGIRYEICRGYHYFCKPPYLNCHHPENLLWQPKMPADNEEENFWPPSQGSRIVWDPTPDSQHKTSIRKRCNGATVGKVQVQWGMFIYFKLDDLCRYWKLCIFIICSWIWTVVTFHIYNKYISSIYIKISYVINAISIFYGCNVTSKGSDIFCKFLVVLPTFWAFWCETHIFNASCATFFLVPSRMPSPQVKLNKDNFYEFCPPCNYLV